MKTKQFLKEALVFTFFIMLLLFLNSCKTTFETKKYSDTVTKDKTGVKISFVSNRN